VHRVDIGDAVDRDVLQLAKVGRVDRNEIPRTWS